MSNYTLNNVRRFITHIDEHDYWDFHLNYDNLSHGVLDNNCLISSIDTSEPGCVNNNELISKKDYYYEDSCTNGLELLNIGYTGVDNGLISYQKDRITDEEFYNIYTGSTYTIESGDTRLHLHKVSGNAGIYDYPVSLNEDGSIKLNGGFYQGFFRSGKEYFVLPSEMGINEQWNICFKMRMVDYEPESTRTLNDKYPNNKGIFFYIGTRSENKWMYLYNNLPLSGETIECDSQEEDIFDLIEDDIVLSAQTFDTNNGFDIYSPNDSYFTTDNKFILFDRSPSGITADDYDGNEIAMVSYKTRRFDGNLFLYMNRTKSGYTVHDIDELEISGGSTTYDNKLMFEDIYNNALAFFIGEDGSIGYKYLVKDCSEQHLLPYKVLSGSSYPGMVKYNDWYDIRIRILNQSDGMRFMFYINDKLKYITSTLPHLNLHELNELGEKQEGVAYNISIGGGTQGLSETIMPDYMKVPTISFPIEENFAGSFIGDIKEFKFYTC